VRAVRVAWPELRYSLERLVSAWDTKAAAEKAQMAYRYVADTYPIGADYTPLEPHVDAAWRAETAGDWPGYLDAAPVLDAGGEGAGYGEAWCGVSSRHEEGRLRKEIAALEAERLRLSEAVMAGEAGALEEDERLEKRLVALSRTIVRSWPRADENVGGGGVGAQRDGGWQAHLGEARHRTSIPADGRVLAGCA
jgi:hypothetical protein